MSIARHAFPLDVRIRIQGGEACVSSSDGREVGWIAGERDWNHVDLHVHAGRGQPLLFHITGANRPYRDTEDEVSNAQGQVLGSIIYRVASGLTKERFDVFSGGSGQRTLRFVIEERSMLRRLVRNLSDDHPWLDFVQGFVLNPSYELRLAGSGGVMACVKKMPSALGTHARIELAGAIPKAHHELVMAVLLYVATHVADDD